MQVVLAEIQRTVGNRIGWSDTPKLFYSSDRPSFVFSDAGSEHVPYLDGKKIPYLIVINAAQEDLDFSSSARMTPRQISAYSQFTFNGSKVEIDYRLTDPSPSSDLASPPENVNELLTINTTNIKLEKGRVISVEKKKQKTEIRQYQIHELPVELFRTAYLTDKERVKKLVKWWRKTHADVKTTVVVNGG